MRRAYGFALVATAIIALPQLGSAQGAEQARGVAGGGVFVKGWTGKIDAGEAKNGSKLENSKLASEGKGMRVTTGPAGGFWDPANTAKGDYTVMATFNEPKFQNLNDHPHPYGIFIGGNDMGTDTQSYFYCAAYGTGTFIARGFGPDAFQMGGRRPVANAAIHKAAAIGEPVTQDIAVSVKGDKVSCTINGTEVGNWTKAELVGPGKLKSLDGTYGIRSAHNTDVLVTNFMKM
jgi:hypothetical protein